MTSSTLSGNAASTGVIESSEPYSKLSEELKQAIAPRHDADELSFEQLADQYNFRNSSDRRLVFTRLIIRECLRLRRDGEPLRVVDIGCGRGIGRDERYVAAMKPFIDEFWGVEPDKSVTPKPEIFDHSRQTLLEDADLPEGYFDMAFSFMVMEHVADPESFYKAVARCLRPGGVHLFMTPNARHYFALVTRSLKAIKVEEFVLRMIKGDGVDEYHYPVQYRCNSKPQVLRHARESGFDQCDFAYMEADGPRPYMKGPLKLPFHMLAWKRTKIRRPDRLLTFIVRMTRSDS